MGISSYVLENNLDSYILLLFCLVKLAICRGMRSLLDRINSKCVPSSLFSMNELPVFLYDVITEAPIMLIPAALALSDKTSISSLTVAEAINNGILLSSMILCTLAVAVKYICERKARRDLYKEKKVLQRVKAKLLRKPSRLRLD